MPDMREEFEAWLLREHGLESEWQEERNCFKDYPAHLAFKAWQASRAALRVELPEVGSAPDGANYDLGFGDPKFANDYREHQVSAAMRQLCREAIQQAGIEVAK
ncbi:TPA: hypothetical protein L4G09_005850 [Pseudomonas aeruginosa]|nr:hypothetical protein [Pseudomonas aeruginosa]HBO1825710.1 hypothetical protein [Pseudomonas aeruginosa]